MKNIGSDSYSLNDGNEKYNKLDMLLDDSNCFIKGISYNGNGLDVVEYENELIEQWESEGIV